MQFNFVGGHCDSEHPMRSVHIAVSMYTVLLPVILNMEINIRHEKCIYLNNNKFYLKLRKSEVTEHEIALVGCVCTCEFQYQRDTN